MTPPDWFLQLLGGGAVALLGLLLYAVVAPRKTRAAPGPRPVRWTPEQQARRDEQARQRAAHAQEVMRPGLLHAAFDRDSVSRGDDDTFHWHLMVFRDDLPISTVLHTYIRRILPSVQGTQATWLIQLHEQLSEPAKNPDRIPLREGLQRVTDLAVVAQGWDAPRLLCPDFAVSRVGNGVVYAHYQRQNDPEQLWQTQQARPNPREEPTRRSFTYDLHKVDPVRRTLVSLAAEH